MVGMASESQSRFIFFRTSLRARVALGVALPILLVLISRSPMLNNDRAMFAQILSDVSRMETVQRVQIISLDGRVRADSRSEQVGTIGLFIDVREAILGLKMAGQSGTGLTVALREFTAQFSRLSSLSVELALAPGIEDLALSAETELQLLRIVQESLTNVRRHASATNAWVDLRINDGVLCLTISDNGKGFNPDSAWVNHRPQFGLSTMRERAEAIGAEFDLDSGSGTGTRVTVRLAAEDLSSARTKAG
jgi:nitrate/nitrite-specific signal transduction histidine kinase